MQRQGSLSTFVSMVHQATGSTSKRLQPVTPGGKPSDVVFRNGTRSDTQSIIELGRLFWGQLDYREAYDPAQTKLVLELVFETGVICCVEAIETEQVVGFIGLVLMPLLCSKEVQATEVAYFVHPRHRGTGGRLLRYAEEQARAKGAKYINMISMQCVDPDGVRKIYESMGYAHVESTFRKELD